MTSAFTPWLVRKLAVEHRLFRRRPRKIDSTTLLCSLVRAASLPAVSLALVGALLGGVSAVAVFKRLGPACTAWLRAVFAAVARTGEARAALQGFAGRILVQDSSVIALPRSCRRQYRGAANQGGTQPQARLQCVLDLVRGVIVWARYDDFRRNDQRSATADLGNFARPGDVVVRDRGYFTVRAIAQALRAGLDVLTRWRFGTGLYLMPKLGQWRPLDLARLLRTRTRVDRPVWVGQALLPMRLVCVPLSAEHAAQRRRQARHDRDQRLAHSREYYFLLGWAIFLTSVEKSRLGARQLATLYRLRWRIEIVFKAAKSYTWNPVLPPRASVHLVEALLWARLLALWLQLRHLHSCAAHQPCSMLRHAAIFTLLLAQLLPLPPLRRRALRRFIAHTSRHRRPGFHDLLAQVFPTTSRLG